MKQQKLTEYRPSYPKKALRGAALTAAAMVAIGGTVGCVRAKIPGTGLQTEGLVPIPEPTEQELVLDGEVAIPESTEEPALQGKILVTESPEKVLVTEGEVAIPDPGDGLVLDGADMIEEPEATPEVPLRTTGVLLMPTATPEN